MTRPEISELLELPIGERMKLEQGALESNSSDPNYIGDGSPNTLLHWDSTAIFQDILETGDFSLWAEEP